MKKKIVLDYNRVCSIIELCYKNNIASLKMEGLEIAFNSAPKTDKVDQELVTKRLKEQAIIEKEEMLLLEDPDEYFRLKAGANEEENY